MKRALLISAVSAVIILMACNKEVELPAHNSMEKISTSNQTGSGGYVGTSTLGDSLSKYRNYTGSGTLGDSVKPRVIQK